MKTQTMTELTRSYTIKLFEGLFDEKSYQETRKKLILSEDDEASYSVIIEGMEPSEEVIQEAMEAQKLLKQEKKKWGPAFTSVQEEPTLELDDDTTEKLEAIAKNLKEKYPKVTLKNLAFSKNLKGTILESEGEKVTQWSKNNHVSINLDVREGGKVETLWKGFYLDDLSELSTRLDDSFEEVSELLYGESKHFGKTKVLLSPDAAGELLGAYAKIFNKDVQRRKGSKFLDKEGQVVATNLLTITDKPHQGPYKRSTDDEWKQTREQVLIEKGVFKTSLKNLQEEGSGSGYRTGLSPSTDVKAVHLDVEAGNTPLKDMQEGTIYITQWEGLFAGTNPASGDFSLQSKGFAFKDGKKTPLKSILVSGNFYDLLHSIEALSVERSLTSYEGVSLEVPAMLVEGLSVIGEQKE